MDQMRTRSSQRPPVDRKLSSTIGEAIFVFPSNQPQQLNDNAEPFTYDVSETRCRLVSGTCFYTRAERPIALERGFSLLCY